MKTLKCITTILLLHLALQSSAQVSVNVNVGTRPNWGPVITNQEYYYLPDVDSYYDITRSQFIFLNNGVWIRSGTLPRRYKNYNLSSGYVVILNDYHGNTPYNYHKEHKVKYYRTNSNHQIKKERPKNNSDRNTSPSKKNGNGNNKSKGKKGK